MWLNELVESFNCAIEGFIYVIRTQRNMRIHFFLAIALFIIGIVLDFSRLELVSLGVIITLVILTEMLNTAVEYTVDLISDSFHPLARIIKDISAGAVLLASISATIFGYLLFSRHLDFSLMRGLSRLKDAPMHITVIAIIIVLSVVMLSKTFFMKGRPLKGGMPSGHAAVAFVIWTVIVFLTSNPLIIFLSFLMAAAIASTRLSQRIHTLWEVIAGAALGFLVTFLLIQVLNRW